MTRRITVLMIVVLVAFSVATTAYASESVGERALNYATAKAQIDISGVGIASATGKIVGIKGVTTKTRVDLYLQQYKRGSWVTIGEWSETNNEVNITLVKTQRVTKGYKYRAKAVCYAYAGTKYEQVTKYSEEISY